MENSKSPTQPALSKVSKFVNTKTSLLNLVAVSLIITLPFAGFYFGTKYQKQKILPTTQQEVIKNIKTTPDNILITDIKKLGSEIIVSEGQTQYAVFLRRRGNPLDYYPFYEDQGSLAISKDLIVMNLETGEQKVYDFTEEFIAPEILEFLKEVTPEGGSHYRLNAMILNWSPFTENTFWGKLSIYSNGDPPVANEIGFFKMDIPNSKIDKYALPNHGLFGAVNENTNAEKVLYESVSDGLSLYLMDFKSNFDRLIISYGKDVFDKHCANFIEYVYTSGFYGDCGRDRGLRADWDEKGISYFDFITQKRVNLEIE